MTVDLGDADAGVAVATWVINDFIQELVRIGKLPLQYKFTRSVGPVELFEFTVILDPPPVFELVVPGGGVPYTRLVLKGLIELRLAAAPEGPPLQTHPLNAAALLGLVLLPGDPVPVVGLRYQGADGTPDPPVTREDLDRVFDSPEIKAILEETTLNLAGSLVQGLNESRFPEEAGRPPASDWAVVLTLMPATAGSDHSFVVTVGPPGSSALPVSTDSFLLSGTGMGVVYGRGFLDLMLDRGAPKKGDEIEEAVVRSLTISMGDTAIEVKGHVVRPVRIFPDVDIRFHGPLVPSLIRGTTGMHFDPSGIVVEVDDEDEVFYWVAKWFFAIGASAMLLTGMGALIALGILTWLTAVQWFWNGAANIENAPNAIRDGLANGLGAALKDLADALDDDTEVGELRVDATPDSMAVVDGNMLFFAQIIIVPIDGTMRMGEYSKKLKRFVTFELHDGRRFRAQELARLMQLGKVTVPGFHQVRGNYVRANHDDVTANNLLRRFKANPPTEVVVK